MTSGTQVLKGAVRRAQRFLKLTFGLILALPLRAFAPLYRLEVQRVWAARIGHLAIEPELLLSSRAARPRPRTRTLFFSEGHVANPFLLRMWRRTLPFGPSWLLDPMYQANKRFPWLQLAPPEWDERHVDLRDLDLCEPHLQFTAPELERGARLLRELGLDPAQPFVCLAVRDSAYLTQVDPSRDWSYHDYRDSDIRTYVRLAEFLADSGYQVVRMGAIVRDPLESDHPLISDYATSDLRSDFGDVFLFAHCSFCVTTSTGMDSIAMAFRRPLGLVNLPVIGGLQFGAGFRLAMFKNLIDLSTGLSLAALDARRPAAMSVQHSQEIEEMGLALADNSEDELEAFGREMLLDVHGRLELTADQTALEREFLSFIAPSEYVELAEFHISPSWLNSLEVSSDEPRH